ncbi:alpha-protein kinase 1-like [Ruditapes philippinarum]|uniref:alpha-protein kinase 1-like n=1 Tax=Ruditapes philippinarum TaxID=129788 RepID=UPI00295B2311|nr:alpha-protein kinase 1-like [Ruditapes philippinarum]XP_060589114.1 alpha-protein kinase 1-like [Ruditapes philippinarum]
MGQQVSVETFTSTTDPDGNKYWTSFDPYPFKVGSKKLVYMGILNGDGPLKGQKCVVKTVRNGAISRNDWMLESNRSKAARDLAISYNKVTTRGQKKITFNCPIMAEIDTMSDCLCINDILGKPKKKWKDSEFVSIELYLRGHFEEFEFGWVPREELVDAEAFSHFTWCQSEGRILVSNLQGIKTSNAYHFTGPVIHSEDMVYGSSDSGQRGIKEFFKLHQCNRICKNWPRLGDGVDLRGWGEYIVMGERYPSAPPLPPSPSFAPPPYTVNDRKPHLSQIPEESEEDENQVLTNSLHHHHDGSQHITRPQFQQAGYQQQRNNTQWQTENGYEFCLDWREEVIKQSMNFNPYYNSDDPVLRDEMFGKQLLWIVKQMRYAVYASTPAPPPYFTNTQGREITQSDYIHETNAREKKHFIGQDQDEQYMLPPPYEDEIVDPKLECVTYL